MQWGDTMQPYQPQPYRQIPPRRRMSGGKVALIVAGSVIGAIIVLGAIGAALAPAPHHDRSAGQQPKPAAAQSSTGTARPAAPARPKAKVLATFTGSGAENTPKFTVSGSWKLKWSYNCSSLGFAGNFIVEEDNSFAGKAGLNEEGKAGHGATWAYGDTGRHFLAVNSECKWTMKVIGTK